MPADLGRRQICSQVFGTDDKPLQHLGEAETCVVIKESAQFAGSWWISDDRGAMRYARLQEITTYETIDLQTMAVADGDVADKQAYEVMVHMKRKVVRCGCRDRRPK